MIADSISSREAAFEGDAASSAERAFQKQHNDQRKSNRRQRVAYLCPHITVLGRQRTNGNRALTARQRNDFLNLRLQLRRTELSTISIRERNLEEFVLPHEYDVIMGYRVEFARSI